MTQVSAFSFDLVKTVRIAETLQSLSDSIGQFLLNKRAEFINSYMFQPQLCHF